VALLACLCATNGWAQAGSGTSLPSSTGSDPKSDTLPQIDGPEKGSNEWQVWAGGAYPKYPVYGVGITPVVWKWNFVTRRRLSPYWEFAGGALFSNHRLVPGGTTFNFTASTAAGVSFPWGKSNKYSWTVDVRCFHISNADLGDRDPSLNSIELRLGFGFFSHRK